MWFSAQLFILSEQRTLNQVRDAFLQDFIESVRLWHLGRESYGKRTSIQVPVKHSVFILNMDILYFWGFPGGTSDKEPACQCRRHMRHEFEPRVKKISWRSRWQPSPVFLPGKFHGQRSLAGYSPWVHKELDTTEQSSTHSLLLVNVPFSLIKQMCSVCLRSHRQPAVVSIKFNLWINQNGFP